MRGMFAILLLVACGKDPVVPPPAPSGLAPEPSYKVARCDQSYDCSDFCKRVLDRKSSDCYTSSFRSNPGLLSSCTGSARQDYNLCISNSCSRICDEVGVDGDSRAICYNSCI